MCHLHQTTNTTNTSRVSPPSDYKHVMCVTSIRLCHLRATNKADVASPTILGQRVPSGETSVKMVLRRSLITVDAEVAAGRVYTAHPDLCTQRNNTSVCTNRRFNAHLSHIHCSLTETPQFQQVRNKNQTTNWCRLLFLSQP